MEQFGAFAKLQKAKSLDLVLLLNYKRLKSISLVLLLNYKRHKESSWCFRKISVG